MLVYQQARKVVVFVVGITMVLVGMALLVLPGPGTLVIFAGLAMLSIEFAWAGRLLRKIKSETKGGFKKMRDYIS